MKKKDYKIITKMHKNKCFKCDGFGIIIKYRKCKIQGNNLIVYLKTKKCSICKGTGIYTEKSYIIIHKGQAFPMDNIN